MKCSMDSLKFACTWRGSIQGARASVRIGGIQLEGCSFDGSRLSENQRDSPTVSEIPVCTVAWVPKVSSFSQDFMAPGLRIKVIHIIC